MNVLYRVFALAVLAALLVPEPAHAQLQEVRQTVFGMDCAPCAYALERRLGSLDGVEKVTVSLNEGEAIVKLAADNRADLGSVRAAVRDAGFNPRATTLRIAGTLSLESGRWILVTPTGERFHVTSATGPAARSALQQHDGQRVVVTGQVAEEEASEAGWSLQRAALAS